MARIIITLTELTEEERMKLIDEFLTPSKQDTTPDNTTSDKEEAHGCCTGECCGHYSGKCNKHDEEPTAEDGSEENKGTISVHSQERTEEIIGALEDLTNRLVNPHNHPDSTRGLVQEIEAKALGAGYDKIVATTTKFTDGDATRTEVANTVHDVIAEQRRWIFLEKKLKALMDECKTTSEELIKILRNLV